MAKSLPLSPAADPSALSILIGGAVQPSDTTGSVVTSLFENKPSLDDAKAMVLRQGDSFLSRVVLLPASVTEVDSIGAGAVLLGTIVRDDASKQTSTHTLTAADGKDADANVVAIQAALAAQKPSRSMASLINAALDALDALNDGAGAGTGITLVIDQTGDGSVKVYSGSGDLNENAIPSILADVSQGTAPATPASPSLW